MFAVLAGQCRSRPETSSQKSASSSLQRSCATSQRRMSACCGPNCCKCPRRSTTSRSSSPSPRNSHRPPEARSTRPGVAVKEVFARSGWLMTPRPERAVSPSARDTERPGTCALPGPKTRMGTAAPLALPAESSALTSAPCLVSRWYSAGSAGECAAPRRSTLLSSPTTVATSTRASPSQATCTDSPWRKASVTDVPDADMSRPQFFANSARSALAASNAAAKTFSANCGAWSAPRTSRMCLGKLCAARNAARCPSGPCPSQIRYTVLSPGADVML
mmetsp:Transcript_106808/g.238367  ORF Transcript_106808/g.238367 Transcript_106808/m.238367 type:complete len:276 (-) Transcript_106808:618-1445(-)